MELARQTVTEKGLVATKLHTRVTVPPVPTARFDDREGDAQVQDVAAVNGQAGRLQRGHKQKHLDGGSDLRNADRYENRAARRRSKKATKSRDRRVRDAGTLRDTVLAQARVAAGETTASPALVANARKALAPRIEALRSEFPEISDDEAIAGIKMAMESLR